MEEGSCVWWALAYLFVSFGCVSVQSVDYVCWIHIASADDYDGDDSVMGMLVANAENVSMVFALRKD